jgi:hypothetical protein
MWPWLILLLVLGLLPVVLWLGRRPLIHRRVTLADLRRFARTLAAWHAPGSFFIAERESGPGFLQLALRDAHGDVRVMEYGLPDVAWSAAQFADVQAALADLDPTVEGGTGTVSRFLRVVMTGDEDQVVQQAVDLFARVAATFGWEAQTTFRVRIQGPRAQGALHRALAGRARGA